MFLNLRDQLRIAAVLKGHKNFIRVTKLSVELSTGRHPGVLHMHSHISLWDRGQGYEVFLMFQENNLRFTIHNVMMAL